MRTFYPSDSCSKESHLNSLNPQSWLQVERGKLPSSASSSAPLCRESFIKVPEPQILPHYKPLDYVEVLAQIHEELESCSLEDRSSLYLLQYQVFRGLGETKLGQRSLRSAWQESTTVHEKVVFGSWLRYEKQGEEVIAELLSSCGKYSEEFVPLDIASYLPVTSPEAASVKVKRHISRNVVLKIEQERIACDRRKIASLSAPFHAMLYGSFTESLLDEIDMSENHVTPSAMRVVRDFSVANVLIGVSKNLLIEVLVFANKFCCESLKDACDRELASLVSSMECAVELMDFALEESSPTLAASCLQVFLYELPESLTDERVVEALTRVNRSQVSTMAGKASFSLYSCLTEVSMRLDPRSDRTLAFLEKVVDFAENDRQRVLGFHRLGCTRLLRKEDREAEEAFETAFNLGHVYSATGLARIGYIQGHKLWGYEKLTSVISSVSPPLGWMYQERSLYCEGDKKLEDLEKATELDPTLTYPYMYRAVKLMSEQNAEAALEEINRILGFKLALECLEIRFCLYLGMDDYEAALRDIQAALTLCPDYRMFDGKVAARQLRTLVYEHVESWTTADCWMQLYEKWSNVDDIGSLSVIYQMLEADACKGVLYFRQSLLLLRLKCPEAAMRSLQLAREHASSDHERLVYEGWILYDTGHCEEGLQKAKESIRIKRSFEAYFLQAYALAESSLDPSSSSTVVSLLEDALKCPSDRLRKGQALNNLGSVYVDCEKLDLAADCYINALKVRHTRAHQGLARVHFLRNDKAAAYEEMTRLIEKAQNNASAYEKRSEYCDRELAKSDLEMVTRLDPLRVYPYRYRAAVLMDSRKEKEAIEELSHRENPTSPKTSFASPHLGFSRKLRFLPAMDSDARRNVNISSQGSSPSRKPSKFSVYRNPALAAASTANSLRPSKSVLLFIFVLSIASVFSLVSFTAGEKRLTNALTFGRISQEAAYVTVKAWQGLVALICIGAMMAFSKGISLHRAKFAAGAETKDTKDQFSLTSRQLELLGIKKKGEQGVSESPKSRPALKPSRSLEPLVPIHQNLTGSAHKSSSGGDKLNSRSGTQISPFSTPSKQMGSPSMYLVPSSSPASSNRASSGQDKAVSSPWSGRRSSARDIATEEQLEQLLAEIDEKITESAGKVRTPPPTVGSFAMASPSPVGGSAGLSGTTRSTPLRAVRMSPGAQKFTTPPKKGEGDFPTPMSLEQAIEGFRQLGVYPQIEYWRDRLRQWCSSVLLKPLLNKIETSHIQVMQTAAKLGVNVTVCQVGADLSTNGTAPTALPVDRSKGWQPSYSLDEDAILHQLRANLVQAIDATMQKLRTENQQFQQQQLQQQAALIPVMQECVDAISEHQRLQGLMKGEWVKGLLPRSSIPADYTVQRIRELAEGTCVKNYEYNGRADAREKNKKWSLEPPTDSHLLLYLFCAYLEHPKWMLHLDPSSYTGTQSSRNPLFLGVLPPKERFPEKYVAVISGVPSTLHPGALVLAVDKLCPPTFALYWDKKVQFTLQGRTALWDSILLMCHKIKVGYGGVVRGMNLGSSALNILQVVDSETDD